MAAAQVVDATQRLQASLAEEHRLVLMFHINITHRIGRPMQAANVIVQVPPVAAPATLCRSFG